MKGLFQCPPLDGIWEAFETINTTNQDVSNTTVLKIRKNF